MSRGIGAEEATRMLFDQIEAQDYCYITFPDRAVQAFAGVGVSLAKHIARSPRGRTDHEETR